jgi:hypothetical protein
MRSQLDIMGRRLKRKGARVRLRVRVAWMKETSYF